MSTQFGVHSLSTSPALRRIIEAGLAYQASGVKMSVRERAADVERRLEQMEIDRRRRVERQQEIDARRRLLMQRHEAAFRAATRHTVTMMEITEAVAAERGLTVAEMTGPSQRRDTCLARQRAYWLGVTVGAVPLAKIAKFFHRDHSTVIHGVRAHEARMASEGAG